MCAFFVNGGPNRSRTCDIYLARVALSQLSYEPIYPKLSRLGSRLMVQSNVHKNTVSQRSTPLPRDDKTCWYQKVVTIHSNRVYETQCYANSSGI